MKKVIFSILLGSLATFSLTACESMASGPGCVPGTAETGLTNGQDSRLNQHDCIPVQKPGTVPSA